MLSAGVSQLSRSFPDVRLTPGLQSPSGVAVDSSTGALQIDPDYLSTQARSQGLNSARKMARHLEGVIAQGQARPQGGTIPNRNAPIAGNPGLPTAPSEDPANPSSGTPPQGWQSGSRPSDTSPSPQSKESLPLQHGQPVKVPSNHLLREWLGKIGISNLNMEKFTPTHVAAMLKHLIKSNPLQQQDVVAWVDIRAGNFPFTEANIRSTMQEFLRFIPQRLHGTLTDQKIRVQVLSADIMGDCPASYKNGVLALNADRIRTPEAFRRTTFHEMAHWVYDVSPAYQKAVTEHYRSRTQGYPAPGEEPLRRTWADGDAHDPDDVIGVRDDFRNADGDEYAGRKYLDSQQREGIEIPSSFLEFLADPDALLRSLNFVGSMGRFSWRETFLVATQILF